MRKKILMPKNLRGKISIIYMGLVALIAIVGSISVFNLARIEKSINGMISNNYKSIQTCEPMITALEHQNAAILGYITSDDGQSLNTFCNEDLTFTGYYNVEIKNITENGEAAIAEKVLTEYADYKMKVSELQKIRDTENETTAYHYYNSEIIPVFTQLNDDINKIIALNQTAMLSQKAKTSRSAQTSLEVIFLISLCAVVTGFFISRHYADKFLRPLRKMTQTVSMMKDGRFDLKLDIRTNDEIGALADEFNSLTMRLNRFEQSTKGQLMNERNQSIAIMKSISDPLLVLDSKFKIVLINDACEKFFGITEEQAQNKHFLESIRDGQLFDTISDFADNASGRRQKIVKLDKGSATVYLNVSVTMLKNERVASYIVLLHNVTSIKEMEQAKTDFIATISHEFKTPLTAVMMGASLLENSGLGPVNHQQREVVRTIQENAQRLSDFVSDLLEISKIESGKSIYHMEPCSVQAIACNSLKQFEDTAGRSGVILRNLIEDGLPLVYADFEKITWVFNNLVGNAVKYTKEGDSITVDAKVNDRYMTVSVADTGAGIPPEFIDRVFDKFVQVKSNDIEARGTGLGLSVAKEIINAHRGTIRVESQLGEGSDFIFTLPLYEENKA